MSSIIENDKYINPLTDFGFKKLFGTEMNKELLIDFLNQILPKNKKVKDLAYSSTDKPEATKKDRKAIFYSTFPIQKQVERGDWNFKLKFVYLELPKFTKNVEELETRYEKWLYVLRHLSDLQERPKALQERVFNKLFQAAEIANFSKEEKEAYEESLKHYRDIKNIVDSSKEEGRLQGIEQGIDKRNLEIAKTMKQEKESIKKIMRYTGLTKEQIEKI